MGGQRYAIHLLPQRSLYSIGSGYIGWGNKATHPQVIIRTLAFGQSGTAR